LKFDHGNTRITINVHLTTLAFILSKINHYTILSSCPNSPSTPENEIQTSMYIRHQYQNMSSADRKAAKKAKL